MWCPAGIFNDHMQVRQLISTLVLCEKRPKLAEKNRGHSYPQFSKFALFAIWRFLTDLSVFATLTNDVVPSRSVQWPRQVSNNYHQPFYSGNNTSFLQGKIRGTSAFGIQCLHFLAIWRFLANSSGVSVCSPLTGKLVTMIIGIPWVNCCQDPSANRWTAKSVRKV